MTTKTKLMCVVCHEIKTTDEFHRDSKKVSGYKSTCKSCRARQWEDYSKTINRNHKEYDDYRFGLMRVGEPPCGQKCPLFKICSNACQTCLAFRKYSEENRFSDSEIAQVLQPC